jgi:hypothetical protein
MPRSDPAPQKGARANPISVHTAAPGWFDGEFARNSQRYTGNGRLRYAW